MSQPSASNPQPTRSSGPASHWALLAGIGLLMLGNGLQGILLGVRAAIEGYDASVTGLIMAGFFAGFLIGARWAPRAVGQVGHIRVFAALACVASTAILVHAVIVDPVVWGLSRLVTGICFAGIFVVAESWLNNAATNESRGQLLAIYMVITFAGVGGGQLLLPVGDPAQTDLFILVSILISVAALPILLTAVSVPAPSEPEPVGLARLFAVSPLGVIGTFAAGLINGTVFGMGAVYAHEAGLSVERISVFMGILIFGAALLQWPIGKASDIFDRRVVIVAVTICAGIAALISNLMPVGSGAGFFAAVALFGGFSLSIHALCLAHTNDHLEPTELVGASSGLVIVLGAGSVLGPMITGPLLSIVGPTGFFIWLAGICFFVAVFTLWRMTRRESVPNEEQGSFVPVTGQASPVAILAAEEAHAETAGPSTDHDIAS